MDDGRPEESTSDSAGEGETFDAEYWDRTEVERPEIEGTEEERAEPRPVDKWRRNTASGAITAALALGFREVFEPERSDTVGIEQEAPAQPTETDGLEIHFDPMNSQGTVVVVHRPDPPDR